MRRVILCGLVLLLGAGAYMASPMRAAWVIRDAIKTGNASAIEHKVLWRQVRMSLRESISKNALVLPEVTRAGADVKPSLWQRVKWAFGSSMLDRFLETYVTPEGLPKLYAYRKTWKSNVKGEANEDKLPLGERIRRFYARVMRAEFKSPTVFEIELRDKTVHNRSYVGVLELHGFEWKLAGLRVMTTNAGGSDARVARAATGHRVPPQFMTGTMAIQ